MKHSAKILVMLITGALAFSGCTADNTTSTANETDISTTDNPMVTETTEKETEEVIPDTKIFPDNAYNDIPAGYKDNITECGTLEEFHYSAVSFSDEEYDKTAYVYLPFGYDSEDKETKYNVLYLMHGGGDCWSVGGSGENKAEYPAGRVSEMGYAADDFYIYAGCGNTGDVAYPNMVPQLDAMKELTDTFVYCDNFTDGNFYYYPFISTGHSIETVNRTIYNALPKFFG